MTKKCLPDGDGIHDLPEFVLESFGVFDGSEKSLLPGLDGQAVQDRLPRPVRGRIPAHPGRTMILDPDSPSLPDPTG